MNWSETASLSETLTSLEDVPSIGYICPLYTELVAVIATFDEYLGQQEVDEDDYHYGRIGGRKAVVVQFLYGEMGPTVASIYAYKLVHSHPSLKDPGSICLLVGIAGGIWSEDRDVRLGDVVIATSVWNWRDGKQTSRGLEPSGFPVAVSKRLRRKLPSFLYHRDVLEKSIAQRVKSMRERYPKNDLKWAYPGRENDQLYRDSPCSASDSSYTGNVLPTIVPRPVRAEDLPKVHDGLIASGNVVLKDSASHDSLHDKRVYAVEMEACGVPKSFFIVRGISDYADSHKNDIWQPYAASVAAACARLLVDHFSANTYQDFAYRFRLNSDASDVSYLTAPRHMSDNCLPLDETDNTSPSDPRPSRPARSDPLLLSHADDEVPRSNVHQTGALLLPTKSAPYTARTVRSLVEPTNMNDISLGEVGISASNKLVANSGSSKEANTENESSEDDIWDWAVNGTKKKKDVHSKPVKEASPENKPKDDGNRGPEPLASKRRRDRDESVREQLPETTDHIIVATHGVPVNIGKVNPMEISDRPKDDPEGALTDPVIMSKSTENKLRTKDLWSTWVNGPRSKRLLAPELTKVSKSATAKDEYPIEDVWSTWGDSLEGKNKEKALERPPVRVRGTGSDSKDQNEKTVDHTTAPDTSFLPNVFNTGKLLATVPTGPNEQVTKADRIKARARTMMEIRVAELTGRPAPRAYPPDGKEQTGPSTSVPEIKVDRATAWARARLEVRMRDEARAREEMEAQARAREEHRARARLEAQAAELTNRPALQAFPLDGNEQIPRTTSAQQIERDPDKTWARASMEVRAREQTRATALTTRPALQAYPPYAKEQIARPTSVPETEADRIKRRAHARLEARAAELARRSPSKDCLPDEEKKSA